MTRSVEKMHELEGLRGVAAFCVVLTHLHVTFFRNEVVALEGWLTSFGTVGFVLAKWLLVPLNGSFCVWVFWVMSALVLSYRFFDMQADQLGNARRRYLTDATLRRYPRLLIPVLASILFGYALCQMHLMRNVELAEYLGAPYQDGWLNSFYTFVPSLPDALSSAFWNTFFSFRQPSQYNPPLWTMKRELIGSFFLFGFLAAFGGSNRRWLVYPVAAVFFFLLRQHWLNVFLAGIAICDFRVNRAVILDRYPFLVRVGESLRKSWGWGLAYTLILMFFVGFFSEQTEAEKVDNPLAFGYAILSTLAVIITQLYLPLRRMFSSRVPVFLGKISFGIYICHFPIIMSFSAGLYLFLAPRWGHLPTATLVSLLTLILSVAGGYVFYLFADRPSLKISREAAAVFLRGAHAVLPAWIRRRI